MREAAVIALKGCAYKVTPDFALVCDIEDELGGIAGLAARFSKGEWKVSELVTLVHMLLQAAGRTDDYRELGNAILSEGVDGHVASVSRFFGLILAGGKEDLSCP